MNRASVSEMLVELNTLIANQKNVVFIDIVMQKKPKDTAGWDHNLYDVIFKTKDDFYKLDFVLKAYNKQDLSATQIAKLYVYVITNLEKIRQALKLQIHGS